MKKVLGYRSVRLILQTIALILSGLMGYHQAEVLGPIGISDTRVHEMPRRPQVEQNYTLLPPKGKAIIVDEALPQR